MSEWVDSNVEKVTIYQKAGGTPPVSDDRFYGDGVPFVVIEDMTKVAQYLDETTKEITQAGLDSSAAWLIKEPHVLYSMYATVGKPVISRVPCATNQAIIALKENDEILQLYLYYALEFIRPSVWKFTSQTTQANLNASVVRRLPVKYPKCKIHQYKIARILQTIDQAIEKTEQLIEKYQRIKAGLMHDLFTRGIGADGQLRPPREQAPELYQETPIGWIPKEWQCELLDDLAMRGSGHTPSKSYPEYWNGGIKWISLADSSRLDNLFISETQFEISQLGLQNSSAVLHPPGVVVLSRDAGVGKSAVTTSSMAVSQHFMCWRCDEKRMHNIFLYYWLQHNKRFFENIAMGSTILTIGLSYFRKLKIGCPVSITEQVQIADRLVALEEKIFTLKSDLLKKRHQKSGLMHDLLTGEVPVSVDSDPISEVTA